MDALLNCRWWNSGHFTSEKTFGSICLKTGQLLFEDWNTFSH